MIKSLCNFQFKGEQELALKFILDVPKTALFMPTGTGKTIVTLLYLKILDKPAVIIAPACIKHVWIKENNKFNIGLDISDDYRNPANIMIISYDWVKLHSEFLDDYDIIICDEAHSLCDTNTIRFKQLSEKIKSKSRVILLSGYPVENKLTEIFVVSLLSGVLGKNYHHFLRKYFDVQTKPKNVFINGKWRIIQVVIRATPKKGSIDEIIKLIKPFAFVSDKAKSFDKPIEKKNLVIRYELSDYQRNMLNTLNEYRNYSDEKIKIQCKDDLVVFGKALQIISGFVYETDDNEQRHPKKFDENPKLEMLRQIVKGKSDFLLWYMYDYEEEMLKEFKNRCRLSKLQTDSRGLNLQHYKFAVYFSLPLSGGQFLQSVDRLHRIGREIDVISIILLPNGEFGNALYRMTDRKHKLTKKFINDLLTTRVN